MDTTAIDLFQAETDNNAHISAVNEFFVFSLTGEILIIISY
jgi:hypothetical protein